jgi:uncharacterized protein (DUF2384 family)
MTEEAMPVQVLRPAADGAVVAPRHRAEVDAVAVKALIRLAAAWRIRNVEAAELAGVSARTFERMKAGTWSGRLSKDQLQRISALVGLYKGLHLYFSDDLADEWPTLGNTGPMFGGGRPVDAMIEGGVPAMIEVRDYVDALRGGV